MHKELKNRIIKQVQDSQDEFQLVNFITDLFRAYIYDSKGEYLIGGEQVAKFIKEFIKIYINN